VDLMSLRLQKAYSSDFNDILHEFYIPALGESSEYCRLAGFFSSTSLAVAARGISSLIRNGGVMKLIVSPRLTRDDLNAILNSQKDADTTIESRLLAELDQLEEEFARDHVAALGWMVSTGRLKIKVAIPITDSGQPLGGEDAERSGLFHQKVGIMRDPQGNTISFSGSVNETAAGWLENIEEFKVFRGWEPAEKQYVESDAAKFDRFWTNRSWRLKVIDVPHAVEAKLINTAPADIAGIDLEKHYARSQRRGGLQLFPHQRDAVDAWLRNNMRGIFAMATGTGKTFTAFGCLDRASRIHNKLTVVISCPYQHLVQQWKREIARFGIAYDALVVADSSNRRWRDKLADSLMDISLGRKHMLVVMTTHSTLRSDDFVDIIRNNKRELRIMLAADEVHGLGAERSQTGLLDEYDFRLGLSATPKRWFDTSGTEAIYTFFGKEVFQFGLEEAINTINPATGQTYLVPYWYDPRFVSLGADEVEDYAEKTSRIVKLAHLSTKQEDADRHLDMLLFARANIIKNACDKYKALDDILDELPVPVAWTIVYCSPQQIDEVMRIVNRRRLTAHRFTMAEGTTPTAQFGGLSEREWLLQCFGEGTYQILVAMKCLDEGVDVPPARTAILMASSGNPREYIQRIGRVIRRHPGKLSATIYDLIALPPVGELPPEMRDIERGIIRKELRRYREIAHTAMNNAEALATISGKMQVPEG
jgi:superfamily II DNA or RNA helicase